MTSSIDVKSSDVSMHRLPVNSEQQTFGNWTIKYTKSHILHSQCNTPATCSIPNEETCQFCIFTNALQLPNFPEMVFPNNILWLTHISGLQIQFTALEALKLVSSGKLDLKVASSETWRESRDPVNLEEKVKPFDWTFSTDYKGSVTGACDIIETDERINMERLKEKEKILFYQELMLFEDELHDNGIASCTVKIRVMPSSFFVLLRYFLRVDGVMVRINDTRYFHDFSTDYVLREYSNRECGVKQLALPLCMFGDPNSIAPHLPLRLSCYEKLVWSSVTESSSNESVANNIKDEKVMET